MALSYNGLDAQEAAFLRDFSATSGMEFFWNACNSFFEHFAKINDCCNTPYFIALHDDDYFLESLAPKLQRATLDAQSHYALLDAVSVRGRLKWPVWAFDKPRLVKAEELAFSYLLGRHAVAFPAVIYNVNLLNRINFLDQELGKYSDVKLMMELASQKLTILPSAIFAYRIHCDQDSQNEDILAKKKCRRYLFQRLFSVGLRRCLKASISGLILSLRVFKNV